MQAVHENIFKESLRSPAIILDDIFYLQFHPRRAWKRIDLAIESGYRYNTRRSYLLPMSLAHTNETGETILIQAAIDYDLEIINIRADAGHLIISD